MKDTFKFEDNVVKIIKSGDFLPDDPFSNTKKAIEFAREKKCNSFLIDMRESKLKFSLLELHDFMASIGKLGYTKNDKIAILFKEIDDMSDYGFRVAQNTGWTNLQIFTDEKKVIDYLKSG